MPDPMNDRDIVIVFGAGASYGAGHVLPEAPPLGLDLYDALATQYPNVWGPHSHIGKMWADKLRRDFERTMAEDVVPWVPSLTLLEWHRCVSQFFARYSLEEHGRDCYSMLLSGLKKHADSTFNADDSCIDSRHQTEPARRPASLGPNCAVVGSQNIVRRQYC